MFKRSIIQDFQNEKISHINILPYISEGVLENIENIVCNYKVAYTNYDVPFNIKEISLLEEFNNWGDFTNFVVANISNNDKKSGYFTQDYEYSFLLKNFLLRNSHNSNEEVKKLRIKIYANAVDIIIENNLEPELLDLFLNNFISTP